METEFDQNFQCKNISYLRARDPSILACGYPTGKGNLGDQLIESISETIKEALKYDDHLQVYLRLKKTENFKDLYEINDNSLLCKVPEDAQCIRNVRDGTSVTKIFKFSKIFGPDSTQSDTFNIIKEKVLQFINGFNCSLLTYGASGSGKTYTIVGTADEPGIIPRALEYLFRTLPHLPEEPQIKPTGYGQIIKLSGSEKKLEKAASSTLLNSSATNIDRVHVRTYRAMQQRLSDEPVAIISDDITHVSLGVWISFAEIYNEYIYDLLTPQPPRGQLRRKLRLGHCNGNPYIRDLTYINVKSGLEAYQLMQYGLHNLKYAATSVNDHSSRSHSIFTIKLAQASDSKEGISVSSFNFCDLAGSERLKKTHNVGDRLKESNNINTSLLVLGRCVSSIRDAQRNNSNKLIPFRESKLTQLFQRALLGHEAISMIVNVNPIRQMFDESQHVLNFSAIAKDVTIEQQQLIQRPRNNRFAQYMEGRNTSFSVIDEELENSQIEELRTAVVNLVEEIQQQKLNAKVDREHTIAEYKKLLDHTTEYWKERCQELEDRLTKCKSSLISHSQEQQTRKRRHSVIVLDSSSEDENTPKLNSKRHTCTNPTTNFAVYQKELLEIQLQLQTKEIEVQKLIEENKSLEKTLQDASKAYGALEIQYETENKELHRKLIQQQDEINTLLLFSDNVQFHSNSDEPDDVITRLQSPKEQEKQISVELCKLAQQEI